MDKQIIFYPQTQVSTNKVKGSHKKKGNEIINICSNKPIKIMDIINHFKKNNYINVKLTKMHRADVKDTHGSNKKLKKLIGDFKVSNFFDCFYRTYEWYIKNNIKDL